MAACIAKPEKKKPLHIMQAALYYWAFSRHAISKSCARTFALIVMISLSIFGKLYVLDVVEPFIQ